MATERKPDKDSDRDLKALLKQAQDMGRGGDTHLVHVGSREIAVLKAMGGAGTINPKTGLQEFLLGSSGGGSYGSGSNRSSGDWGGGGGGGGGSRERTSGFDGGGARMGVSERTGGNKGGALPKVVTAATAPAAAPAEAAKEDFSDVQLKDVDAPLTDTDSGEAATAKKRKTATAGSSGKSTLDLLRALS